MYSFEEPAKSADVAHRLDESRIETTFACGID